MTNTFTFPPCCFAASCRGCRHYLPDETRCDFRNAYYHPDKSACADYLPRPQPTDRFRSIHTSRREAAIQDCCHFCRDFHPHDCWCSRFSDFADPIRFNCF